MSEVGKVIKGATEYSVECCYCNYSEVWHCYSQKEFEKFLRRDEQGMSKSNRRWFHKECKDDYEILSSVIL